MEKSKVYFTDFRTRLGEGLPSKLKRLMKAAGIQDMDMDHKFVAIKMHFGELGNLGYLRPNYAKAVADVVKELGGIPFLTDCNTLYPGSRKNAIEHMYCAWENGFTPLTVGCPVIISRGMKRRASAVLSKISVWAADPEPAKWNSTLRANRRSMRICAVAANDA